MNEFYVYALLDPRKPGIYKYLDWDAVFQYEPFYIGKGKGRRCFEHLGQLNKKSEMTRKANKIRKIYEETGKKPIIIKLKEGLFEEVSLELEKFFIMSIGRMDLTRGPLTNATDGGDGAGSGRIVGENEKRLKSKRFSGENNPMFGKTHSEEVKKMISEKFSGSKHPLFGKTHRAESIEKMRVFAKNRKTTEETKKKLSLIFSGSGNRMYGKKHTDETKKKISEQTRGENSVWFGKKHSEETKEKMRKSWEIRKMKQTRKTTNDSTK